MCVRRDTRCCEGSYQHLRLICLFLLEEANATVMSLFFDFLVPPEGMEHN